MGSAKPGFPRPFRQKQFPRNRRSCDTVFATPNPLHDQPKDINPPHGLDFGSLATFTHSSPVRTKKRSLLQAQFS